MFLQAKLKIRHTTEKTSPPVAKAANKAVIQILTVAVTKIGVPSYGMSPSMQRIALLKCVFSGNNLETNESVHGG